MVVPHENSGFGEGDIKLLFRFVHRRVIGDVNFDRDMTRDSEEHAPATLIQGGQGSVELLDLVDAALPKAGRGLAPLELLVHCHVAYLRRSSARLDSDFWLTGDRR